jgi:hypothetical protein
MKVNMMKVLLVNPPQTFFPGSDAPAGNLPLGLMYKPLFWKGWSSVEILMHSRTRLLSKNRDTSEIGMPMEE